MKRVTRASSGTMKRAPSPVSTPAAPPSPTKRAKVKPSPSTSSANLAPASVSSTPAVIPPPKDQQDEHEVLLHPVLTFKYEDARKHLIAADHRWEAVMDMLKCKPYEEESDAPFDPFRSLTTSLLGQQISWLAARSITHKFCRLFDPSLPEKPLPPGAHQEVPTPFPTPHQIVALPNQTPALRSAGLSGRKVEYVIELAERFVDGRLDAKKLWEMNDDQVKETLLEVRGIGVWTVQMFLMFSMRRPNILACGDLGLQKGMARWYSSSAAPSIIPNKLPAPAPIKEESETPNSSQATLESSQATFDSSQSTQDFSQASQIFTQGSQDNSQSTQASSVFSPPATPKKENPLRIAEAYPTPSTPGMNVGDLNALGEANLADGAIELESPSQKRRAKKEVKKTKSFVDLDMVLPPTSTGLTSAALRARLNGKKAKGNYLTPQEMEELAAPWEPYRSVACWYLWCLTDGTGDP